MNILCFMLMTLRHVYSRGAKTKLLDISYWLVPSSRDSDIPWGQSFLVLEAVGFARAALSWDHWNKNSELEHYYQKSQGSHWHRHQSRQTRHLPVFRLRWKRFLWAVFSGEWGVGLAARQALGRSSWFGIAYEKNQLSGFQGIKFPWKPTLSGSIEYHGPPRSGRLSFP